MWPRRGNRSYRISGESDSPAAVLTTSGSNAVPHSGQRGPGLPRRSYPHSRQRVKSTRGGFCLMMPRAPPARMKASATGRPDQWGRSQIRTRAALAPTPAKPPSIVQTARGASAVSTARAATLRGARTRNRNANPAAERTSRASGGPKPGRRARQLITGSPASMSATTSENRTIPTKPNTTERLTQITRSAAMWLIPKTFDSFPLGCRVIRWRVSAQRAGAPATNRRGRSGTLRRRTHVRLRPVPS